MLIIYRRIIALIRLYDPSLFLNYFFSSLSTALSPILIAILPLLVFKLDYNSFSELFLSLALFAFLLGLLSYVGEYTASSAWMRFNRLRFIVLRKLLKKVNRLDYASLIKEEMQNRIQIAKMSALSPDQGLGKIMTSSYYLGGKILASIAVLLLIGQISFLYALLVLALQIIAYLIQCQILVLDQEIWQQKQPDQRNMHKLSELSLDESTGAEIRLQGMQSVLTAYAQRFFQGFKRVLEAGYKKQSRLFALEAGFKFIQYFSVYAWLLYLLYFEQIQLSEFFATALAIFTLSRVLSDILRSINVILQESKKTKELFALIEEDQARPSKELDLVANYQIDFENVSFTYPGAKDPVFTNFNLTIRSGETLGLIGKNGAGKSTLIHLLCRFFKPDSGRILVGGINIEDIPRADYQLLLGPVFQDGVLFPFSLQENISLEASLSKEKHYASLLGQEELFQFIQASKEKDQTYLGSLFGSGREVSGGEAQKLLFARAAYKDAAICLLDEPTAAIDPRSEDIIYQAYKEYSKSRTCIIISHKLSFIAQCERIVVLAEGRIVEDGSHSELMALDTRYKKLYLAQKETYQDCYEE